MKKLLFAVSSIASLTLFGWNIPVTIKNVDGSVATNSTVSVDISKYRNIDKTLMRIVESNGVTLDLRSDMKCLQTESICNGYLFSINNFDLYGSKYEIWCLKEDKTSPDFEKIIEYTLKHPDDCIGRAIDALVSSSDND